MELAGDFLRACHGGRWFGVSVIRWFGVSVVRCVPLVVAVDELCLMLCPCRDTLLNVSTRDLWVQGSQWLNGLVVQMRSRRLSRDRG